MELFRSQEVGWGVGGVVGGGGVVGVVGGGGVVGVAGGGEGPGAPKSSTS